MKEIDKNIQRWVTSQHLILTIFVFNSHYNIKNY